MESVTEDNNSALSNKNKGRSEKPTNFLLNSQLTYFEGDSETYGIVNSSALCLDKPWSIYSTLRKITFAPWMKNVQAFQKINNKSIKN